MHLRHQVADLSGVHGLRVDNLGRLWSRNNDWALALESVGGLIVGGCGLGGTGRVHRAFLGEESGRLVFDRVVERFLKVIEVARHPSRAEVTIVK